MTNIYSLMNMDNQTLESGKILIAQRDLSLAMAGIVNINDAAAACLDTALKISGLDAGSVHLVEADNGLRLVAHRGLSERFLQESIQVSRESSHAQRILEGKPIYTSTDIAPWKDTKNLESEGLLGAGIIPVFYGQKVIASLNVASRKCDDIPQTARAALEVVAATLGNAIAWIRAQEALKESEEKFRFLAENQKDVVLSVGLDRIVRYCSPAIREFSGYEPSEVEGRDYLDFVVKEEDRRFIADYTQEQAQQREALVVEFLYQPKDRDPFFVEVVTTRQFQNGKVTALNAIMRDITKRKRMEQSRQDNERQLRSMMEAPANFAVYRLKFGTEKPFYVSVVFARPSLKSIFGIQDPMNFDSWWEIIHPEDRQVFLQASLKIFKDKSFQKSARYYHPGEKRYRWLKVIASATLGNDGKPKYTNGVVLDITDRMEAEQRLIASKKELEQSEEKYRHLVENASEGIGIIQDGFFKFPNQAACELIGLDREEAKIIDPAQHIHTLDKERTLDTVNELLSAKRKNAALRIRIIGNSGATRWVMANLVAINWESRPAVLAIMRDVTHEKHLEAKLRQAQKMEAIGTLAGGIAHNFNNLLNIIMGFTELTMSDQPGKSRARANLQQVLNASNRAKDLVSQILTFSRQDSMEKVPMNLVPLVSDSVKLLQATLPATVKVESRIPSDACAIKGNDTQMKQLIMNLGTNAVNAMNNRGGTLSIVLDRVEAEAWELEMEEPGLSVPAVRLKVIDTGRGMDQNTLAQIFDPYFTTMEPGQGTGLGLSVVHGIVKGHGGSISVRSTPGKGTSFTILFPRIESESMDTSQKPAIAMGNGEHVVFVDDEPSITELGKNILERLNYRPTTFENPLKALEFIKKEYESIDLVVTDQTMPLMTGEVLISKIRELSKSMPVIACTGHSDFFDRAKAKALEIQAFCTKPLSLTQFSETVHRVLKASKSTSF